MAGTFRVSLTAIVCVGVPLACGGAPATTATHAAVPPPCNGHAELCDRRFNEVAYPTAHNAMSNEEDGWFAPNQEFNIPTQLRDGVRGYLIDIHYNEVKGATDFGKPYFCHGNCALGREPAAVTLGYFKTFLDDNPREIVIFDVEQSVSETDMIAAMDGAGLSAYAVPHVKSEPWPTLGQMIADNRRLVFFTEQDPKGVPVPPWYLYIQAHTWDTPFHVERPEDFVCTPDRGDPKADLMLLNHFLTAPIASLALADSVNHDPFLYDRAVRCRKESGQMPNFVAVDFYATGDLFEAVDRLNGVGK